MPIGYSVTDYVNNSVPYITATTLNNSEAGIKAACDALDAMETLVTTDGLLLTPSLESEPTYANGLIFIHPDEKCPSVYTEIEGVTLNLSQELTSRGVNNTGDTLPNGTIGYMSGVLGNRPTIAPAQANSATTAKVYGMFTHDVANNVEGFVTHIGLVHDLDTSAFEAGDTLYLSATTPGAFTNVAPTAPNYVLEVGRVLVSHATQGIIFFSVPSTSVLTGIVVNSVTVNNDVTVGGNINGRDIEADGTKLDGIESGADVTDATNVAAAGALMKSGGTMTGALSMGNNSIGNVSQIAMGGQINLNSTGSIANARYLGISNGTTQIFLRLDSYAGGTHYLYLPGATGSAGQFLVTNGGDGSSHVTASWSDSFPFVDVPASASASGTVGQMAKDSNYLYICIATDTWKRAPLSTW